MPPCHSCRFDQPGSFVGGGYAGAIASRRGMTRAYQARIQSLAQVDGKGGYVALPDAGVMGTNKAFINNADGSGQSTKARTQSLYQESFEQASAKG